MARTRQGIYNLKKSKKATKQLLELNQFKVSGIQKDKFRYLQQIKYDYCQRGMLLAINLVCCCFTKNRIYKMYKKGAHLLGREMDLVRIIKLLRFVKFLRKQADLSRLEKFQIKFLECGIIEDDFYDYHMRHEVRHLPPGKGMQDFQMQVIKEMNPHNEVQDRRKSKRREK